MVMIKLLELFQKKFTLIFLFETALFINIVKVILFFYSVGPVYFSSYIFSFSFLGFPPSLILALTISLLSLSLLLLDVLPPSPTKPKSEHQGKPISIAVVSFFLFFLFSF